MKKCLSKVLKAVKHEASESPQKEKMEEKLYKEHKKKK